MKAAAYLRVSSAAQSLAMQNDAIVNAATVRGDELVQFYSEKASAKVNARPERERLLQLREAKLALVSPDDLDRAKKAIDGATAIARKAEKKAQEKLVMGAALGYLGAQYFR
jgi:DNA invertase Pin-like site-specific DNA recombinase